MLTIETAGPILRSNKYILLDDGTPVKEFQTEKEADIGLLDYAQESLDLWLDDTSDWMALLTRLEERFGLCHNIAVLMVKNSIS